MIKIEKGLRFKIIVLSLLWILLINQFLIINVHNNQNYNLALEKGTQIIEVKIYDEELWKNVVHINSTPNDWFRGEADKIGAKSKTTILDWSNNDFNTYTMFIKFAIPPNYLAIFSNISNYGYNFSYINNNYPNYYKIWDYTYNYWNFTSKEFNINPDDFFELSFILKDPHNFTRLLIDYNNFAGVISNDTTLQLLGYSLPILSGDDLIWQFIIGRFAVLMPIKEYLTIFADSNDCKNITIQNNKLIFQKHGLNNYSVEVIYNSQGSIETFIVKDSEGNVMYEIISFYPKTVFYIILGIIGIFTVGIVLVFVIKTKFKKNY